MYPPYPGQDPSQNPAQGQYPGQAQYPAQGATQDAPSAYPGQQPPQQQQQQQQGYQQPAQNQGYAGYGATQNQGYAGYGATQNQGYGAVPDQAPNYGAYPAQQGQAYGQPGAYGAAPQPGGQGVIPSSVNAAVYIMFAGAALEIIGLIINIAGHTGTPTSYVGAIIGAGLWIWMALMIRAGKNWARITGSVLFGLETLLALLVVIGLTDLHGSVGGGVVALALISVILIWLIGLSATVLMWRPQSSAYFRQAAAPQYW